MRISTLSIAQSFVANLGRQQSELARTQQQVSTGLRFDRPSQDPVAATRALELSRALEEMAQYATNSELARNRLALAEGALTGVGDTLQRLRELAVQAANGTETNESRRLIAAEVRQRLEGLLQLANAQDGNGQYLFAGYASRTQPFSQSAGGFQYHGDQGQRLLQIGPGRSVADGDSGARVFQRVRDGNGTFAVAPAAGNAGSLVVGARSVVDAAQYDGGAYVLSFPAADAWEVRDAANAVVASGAYASGRTIEFRGLQLQVSGTAAPGDGFAIAPSAHRDVFASVQQFLDALQATVVDDRGDARLRNALNGFLENVDQALGNVLEVRAEIGGRLRAIEDQQRLNADLDVELRGTLSQVRDLDYAEALTRLNQQLVGLEAAQKSFVRMQGLSLFNWL